MAHTWARTNNVELKKNDICYIHEFYPQPIANLTIQRCIKYLVHFRIIVYDECRRV